MIRTTSFIVAALFPLLAGAQLESLKAAKGAAKTSADGNLRIEKAIDEATAADRPGQPPAAAEAVPAAGDSVPAARRRPEGSAATADQGLGSVPPPDTYTVRPGDTLWDLSGRFLNNPWYWPKVWSFNPDITNPHWIEPGNVLKFYPSQDEAPTRVETVASSGSGAVAPSSAEEPVEAEPPRELEDLSRADMKAPAPVEEQDDVAVVGPYKVGYVAPKTVMIRRDSFVTPTQVEESGSIIAAFEEKLMLSASDRAYATFKGEPPSKLGETYLVYETVRPIHHPISGDLVGYQTRILGAAVVVARDPKAVTIVITGSLAPIERGALLGPWTEKPFRPVKARAATKDLDGFIVGTRLEVLTQIAEQNVVFIDKGKADGVEEGNVFKVMRSGDPYGLPLTKEQLSPPNDPRLPAEVLGELMVIDVKESTSTALVMKSRRELLIGDVIEMRVPGGAPAEAGSGGR
jgi:nucleoid-associated protein YgaU